MNLRFTDTCSCAALTDTIWSKTSGSCLAMPTRMNAGIWIVLSCQPDYRHVNRLFLRVVCFRYGAKKGVCLPFILKSNSSIYSIYEKKTLLYKPHWDLEHSGFLLLWLQIVKQLFMFSVLQEQGYTTACDTNMTQALGSVHFCYRANLYELLSLYRIWLSWFILESRFSCLWSHISCLN